MSMNDPEGGIQYELSYVLGPPADFEGLDEIIAWRKMLRRLGLLGQDETRYLGLGFGNVSLKLQAEGPSVGRPPFIITGSQTGALAELGPEHFALITDWDIHRNRLEARGPIKPSSEALTHAAVYEVGGDTCCVMHVHSPEIWRWARELALPTTSVRAAHGTPEMAREVKKIVQSRPPRRLLAMQGHEDGVLAWGGNIEAAGLTLLAGLAQAFRFAS
jgi:ribulose-5-phosphate 4-epimerase/fuculose-1-phosphate aldolase